MNWAPIVLMGVPALMYLGQGVIVYAAAGRWGMALAMSAYALANVGLIMDALEIR